MLKNLILVAAALTPPYSCSQTPEARFWTWFQAHESALFAVVTAREPICSELTAQLHKIQPDLTFEFGPVESGRREFILSADGIREAFPFVQSLAAAAPELPRWTIVRFRPARPHLTTVRLGELELDARSIEFLAEQDGDKANLTISVPGYKVTPQKAYEQAVFLLLDRMLSEYSVEMGIGDIDIIPRERRPKGDWLTLTRLSETVKTTPIK